MKSICKATYVSMAASRNTRERGSIRIVDDPRDGQATCGYPSNRRTILTLRRSGRDRWVQELRRVKGVSCGAFEGPRDSRPVAGGVAISIQQSAANRHELGFSTRIIRFRRGFSFCSNTLRRICVLIATGFGKIAAEGQI